MDSLSFRIPKQQPPGPESFDTRPAALQHWVEELPLAHTGETAKRLFHMLHEVNRLEIPLSSRYEVLEGVQQPLQVVLDALERHYAGQPFPLPPKGVRVAHIAIGLLREVVIGYQAVLNGEENASWFFRKTHTGMWVEVVHRLIYYINHIICNYRVIHRPVPAGLWPALHRLYWTAREHKRHTGKLKPLREGGSSTIEAEYKRCLLMSMIEPQLLGREQRREVDANMALWLKHSRLVEGKQRSEGVGGYCIRHTAEAPYTELTRECCRECDHGEKAGLLFELEELGHFIEGLLEHLGSGEQLRPKGGELISRTTLEVLRESWHIPGGKRLERVTTDLRVDVAIGMSSIFAHLRGTVDASAAGISDQQMSDELEEFSLQNEIEFAAERNRGVVMGARPEKDVWSTIFSATEITPNTWSRDIEEQEYRLVHAVQRNQNSGGYGLEFDKQQVEPFQVGELMAVADGDTPLHLCMVRWLTEEEEMLVAGLMRLADSVEPVLVVMHQDGRRTALHCLLGIGEDSHPTLFLPHLPTIREKQLNLVIDGKEVPLTLHAQVVVSPLFEAFHFHAVEVNADRKMSLEKVNKKLHGMVSPESVGEKKGDFDDLWDSL